MYIIGIMTCINNHIHVKLEGVIIHACPNFNGGLINPPLNLGVQESLQLTKWFGEIT